MIFFGFDCKGAAVRELLDGGGFAKTYSGWKVGETFGVTSSFFSFRHGRGFTSSHPKLHFDAPNKKKIDEMWKKNKPRRLDLSLFLSWRLARTGQAFEQFFFTANAPR